MYLLDANVFIQAANSYYSLDTVPAFWDFLATESGNGTIRTLEAVKDEVESPTDLVTWLAQPEIEDMFIDESNGAIQARMTTVSTWVAGEPFGPEHIASFLGGADPWLVAAAVELEATVVTFEQRVAGNSRKVKIPNVCDEFDVPVMDSFEMLRELGAVFS